MRLVKMGQSGGACAAFATECGSCKTSKRPDNSEVEDVKKFEDTDEIESEPDWADRLMIKSNDYSETKSLREWISTKRGWEAISTSIENVIALVGLSFGVAIALIMLGSNISTTKAQLVWTEANYDKYGAEIQRVDGYWGCDKYEVTIPIETYEKLKEANGRQE